MGAATALLQLALAWQCHELGSSYMHFGRCCHTPGGVGCKRFHFVPHPGAKGPRFSPLNLEHCWGHCCCYWCYWGEGDEGAACGTMKFKPWATNCNLSLKNTTVGFFCCWSYSCCVLKQVFDSNGFLQRLLSCRIYIYIFLQKNKLVLILFITLYII